MSTPESSPAPSVSKGLEGIIAAHTRLSDVRGDVGQLIYCGYDINELAGKVSYEEVVHLLFHNHLPNLKELKELKAVLAGYRELPQGVIDMLCNLPVDCPPMHAIRTGVSALGCYDTVADDDTMDALRYCIYSASMQRGAAPGSCDYKTYVDKRKGVQLDRGTYRDGMAATGNGHGWFQRVS